MENKDNRIETKADEGAAAEGPDRGRSSAVRRAFAGEFASFEGKGTGYAEFAEAFLAARPEAFVTEDGKETMTLLRTKSAFAFASALLSLQCNREKFSAAERDEIRCAILLNDSAYDKNRPDPRHPETAAEAIRSDEWDGMLPSFVRNEIAQMVETHSGEWNDAGDGKKLRKPSADAEKFAHECVFLSSRLETTTRLPVCAAARDAAAAKAAASANGRAAFENAMETVAEMTAGRSWDGLVRYERDGAYAYLDGQRVPVAKNLEPAFLTIGEARRKEFVGGGPAYGIDEFAAAHPGWDGYVYGEPGRRYVIEGNGTVKTPISEEQAAVFGAGAA